MTDSPDWARGQPLALLREIAGLFARQFKPHIYGAFGLPKEAEIAKAIEDGEIAWHRGVAGAISGAALFRVLRSPSRHRDFAGREAMLHAGDLLVRAIAGDEDSRWHVIDHLSAASGADAMWIEDFVESPEAALWPSLRLESVMTKIAASSDIKGLWHIGERAGRFPDPLSPADAPALVRLDRKFLKARSIKAALAEIAAYVSANEGAWAQHYSNYNKRQSWTALAIRGFDPADPGFIIKPAEMSRGWRAENPDRMSAVCGPTAAAPSFPAILDIAARLPGAPQRIRLMRLASGGGELTRHADIVDPEAGTADGMTCRLHIPLQSPAECRFLAWDLSGARIDEHFEPGELFYLDTRKPHAVINPGDHDRIHIVIDQFSGPELREWIASS